MSWNPDLYLSFADKRLRPALELLARVPLEKPQRIVDLGCGAGNVTRNLAERWPDAALLGIDNSPEMLMRARKELPQAAFAEADIDSWMPEEIPDLIYSNAALHWLPDHASLLPKLFAYLATGGVLAVQMPQTSHGTWRDVLRKVAAAGPWAKSLAPLLTAGNVLTPQAYHGLLSTDASHLDIWECEYLQVLEGKNPVAEWTQGAGLRPYLAALEDPQRSEFFETYAAWISEAYPKETDGTTLMPFRRLFLVAKRA